MRGEEPVFVVTGRKEDVCAAKREILSAAEHFSQIRAQRKNNLNGALSGPGPNSNIPGQTTIQVRVPYRVVGLVVGPKGATIKRIQQQTNTYIITPSRDKEPIFEVTGLPENVDTARKEIEAHIAMRTGGVIDSASGHGSISPSSGDLADNGLDVFARGNSPDGGLGGFGGGSSNNCFGLYSKSSADSFNAFSARDNLLLNERSQDIFSFGGLGSGSKLNDIYPFNTGSSFGGNNFGLYESDEGLGDSPTFDSLVSSGATTSSTSSSVWPEFGAAPRASFSSAISPLDRRSSSLGSDGPSSTSSISSVDRLTGHATSSSPDAIADLEGQHAPARRLSSEPLSVSSAVFSMATSNAPTAAFSTLSSSSSSPTESLGSIGSLPSGAGRKPATSSASSSATAVGGGLGPQGQRDCIVCFEGSITAALVPCGHNLFCMECASRVCKSSEPSCPVCHQSAAQAIRIYS